MKRYTVTTATDGEAAAWVHHGETGAVISYTGPSCEHVLRHLDECWREARMAVKASPTLDEKVKWGRLATYIEETRRGLRHRLFDMQDAAKLAATVEPCDRCGATDGAIY